MSTRIYFVADIHLERNDAPKKAMFLEFVRMVKNSRGDLYILGDLFDYWANNREVVKDNQAVLDALGELSRNGSQVGFVFGNRDLLLGEKALSRYGVSYLGEKMEVSLQGKELLLTHGHLLYTDDVEFQRYRKKKWPLYRMLDTFLPGFIENKLAQRFILKSKKVIEKQEPWRLRFSEEAIAEVFKQGTHAIICGHSHQSMIKKYEGDKYFIVLPYWTSSRGGYLYMEGGDFKIEEYLPART